MWRRQGGLKPAASSAAPFPVPAHQTGRAHFGHPAFRLASSQTHVRAVLGPWSRRTPNEPYTRSPGNWRALRRHLVPPSQEISHTIIHVLIDCLIRSACAPAVEVLPASQLLI